MNQPSLAYSARSNRAQRGVGAPESVTTTRISVAWHQLNRDAESPPAKLELVAKLEADSSRSWTCPEGLGSNWIEAISAARCSEIVLTARIDNDPGSKHSVLELAQFLAFTLVEKKPLIRVVFLAAAGARS